jgi:quercetin dioxygenase-like cupin family protein
MHTHLDLNHLTPQLPEKGVLSRPLISEEHVRVIWFGFDAGQLLSEHTAACPVTLQVLSGEGTVTLGDERLAARAGFWAYLPAHLPHSIEAATPLCLLLTMIK